MDRVLRLVLHLVLVYSVICQDDCTTHENGHFEICLKNPETLSSVQQLRWRFDTPIPHELQLDYNKVTNVSPQLFVGKTEISVLKLNLANDLLNVDPLSFSNLPDLERLEFNNGFVLLKEKIFRNLGHLDSLVLGIDERIYSLYNVLQRDLKNLTSLEIVNAKKVSVCPEFSNHRSKIDTIRQLTYRGGSFHTLKALEFSCLRNLEELRIIESNLAIIETYAFGRLGKLRLLELSGNRKLTRIPSFTLDNFEALDTLLLMNNQIHTIDEAAFRNLYYPLKMLNISGNSMKLIEEKSFDGLRCTKVDLSFNPTWDETSLATDLFNNSQIQELYVSSAVFSRENFIRWGLQKEKTSIHYRFSAGGDDIVYGNNSKNSTSTIRIYKTPCHGEDCHGNQKFGFCVSDKSQLTHVKAMPGVNETDVILNLDELSVEANAFHNPATKKLTITLIDGQKLTLVPYARVLEGLQELQVLNGPLVVHPGTFINLKSLKMLSIQLQNSSMMLCEILAELPNLEQLELYYHQGIQDVCLLKCRKNTPSIKRLTYMNGVISIVTAGSLSCLKNLENLQFHSTRISSIEEGAFRGLGYLKSLSLFNNSLAKVSAEVFFPLVSLNYLQFNKIGIRSFDSHKFKQIADNTSTYADYVDQLFFGLSYPQLLKFSLLNIYRDDLAEIRFAGDEIKWISRDNRRQYSSKSVSKMSFLPPGVFPVVSASDVPSRAVDGDFGDFCRNPSLETPFQICIHERDTLVSVRPVRTSSGRQNPSLTIHEIGISLIKAGAFSNTNINQLLLMFPNASRLQAAPQSFKGLSGLETLILHTGPLELGPNLFQELVSLVELRFSYRTAGGTRLCQVLADLPKLQSLVVYDHDHIDICHASCKSNDISQLQYIGGGITVLESGSLKCLKKLERLTITETNLIIIQPNAFEGLDSINTLEMTYNEHLIYIPTSIFDHMKTLKRLYLQVNSIQSIGKQAFKFSKHANLEVLDLSYNDISVIDRWAFADLYCLTLNISYNRISDIRPNSFQDSHITDLFMVNEENVVIPRSSWGLRNYTTVF